MTTKRAIPELSIDTQTVERILVVAAVGEVVPYGRLSEAIGRNVQNGARYVLKSACDRLLREQHMVFEAVRGDGVKRLDDAGVVGTGTQTLKKIHNAARRGARKLAAVQDFNALPNEKKVQHNLIVAQLGMLAHVTSGRVAKRLEEETRKAPEPLPTARLLEAMKASL
jgi:hypothetical protein